ncbi:MAG: hypothetical protein M3297_05830 [Thermoproteota archaeon]|nr:hypothetical protein [Thermoproteota archaeon]
MSSIPRKTDAIKIKTLMEKMRLHKLSKEEAQQFLPLLEMEIKEARIEDKRVYEKVLFGLTEVLKMYLADTIDLEKPNFEILNELTNLKVPD